MSSKAFGKCFLVEEVLELGLEVELGFEWVEKVQQASRTEEWTSLFSMFLFLLL
jgi:hypothetical protein